MVIIEGMDNSGKSTLAIKLAYEFRVPLIPSPGVKFDTALQFAQWIYRQYDNLGFRIHDRHPIISEAIYGVALRGENRLNREPIRQVCRIILDKSLIIYCRPPVSVIKGTYGDREQLEGTHKRIDELVSKYDEAMDSLGKPVYSYDYTKDSHPERVLKMARQHYEKGEWNEC